MVELNLCQGKREKSPRKIYPNSISSTTKPRWSDRDANLGPHRGGGRQATKPLAPWSRHAYYYYYYYYCYYCYCYDYYYYYYYYYY